MTQELIQTDVLIIGSGIAGATTAIELSKKNPQIKIILLSKAKTLNETNTRYAQGGIIAKGGVDLEKDILSSGDGIALPEAARILSTEGPELVKSILIDTCSTPFDKASDGSLAFALEGGHSEPRVAKVADFTGKSIQENLTNALQEYKNITILTDITAIDLLTLSHHSQDWLNKYKDETCVGVYGFDQKDKKVSRIIAKKTVLASGGYSQVFAFSTNPQGTRGDGVAMAQRAGARLLGLEFQQFHPTALKIPGAPPFLISEAVRGEGARLTDKRGVPFMQKYFPELQKPDLTTRDKVSRSIFTEMINTGTTNVYLNLKDYISKKDILQNFPVIYKTCKSFGVDITKELVPISPAAHYSCGGVLTDLNGQTTIKNLYAIGEVACTGLHGGNRLASTSLLEGLVFGARCAKKIIDEVCHSGLDPESIQVDTSSIPSWEDHSEYDTDPALIAADTITIKNIMWNMVGLVRRRKIIERAITDLTHLEESINNFYRKASLSDELLGLRNMAQVALLVAKAALANPKSIGCHYREN